MRLVNCLKKVYLQTKTLPFSKNKMAVVLNWVNQLWACLSPKSWAFIWIRNSSGTWRYHWRLRNSPQSYYRTSVYEIAFEFISHNVYILGSYVLHTDHYLKSETDLVRQYVTLRTRWHVTDLREYINSLGTSCFRVVSSAIDPLHKWRLNLNNNTWYILSLTFMWNFLCLETWMWG